MPQTLLECDTLIIWANDFNRLTKRMMIEQASWLIQSVKGDRSKRLFGLPASLVTGKKNRSI